MAYFDQKTKIFHGEEVPPIYHPNASLGQVLLFNFFKTPSKVIQVSADDGIELTCGDLSDMMEKIAQNLHKLGLRLGDIAGLLAKNTTFVAPTIFGCYRLGLPVSPLDVQFNVDQIVQIYQELKPKIVFCDHDVLKTMIKALEIMKSSAIIVILTKKLPGYMHISDLLTIPLEPVKLSMDLGITTDICGVILCTSGSSGKPKLACISHAQLLQFFKIYRSQEDTFSLNFSSLYWMTGFSNITYLALNNQKRLITSKQFTPDICYDLIEKYKLKHVFLLPPHIALFVESPRFKTADLSCIKIFTTGGIYMSEQLRKVLLSNLPNGIFVAALGMTESGGIVCETDPRNAVSSAVGKPTANTQIKILIDDGTIGGFHEIGEVLVKKPTKFLGYFESAQPTIMDHAGWIHTGDMGYIDETPELHIVGQRSFIIRNFYNEIYPIEIEEIIEKIAGVRTVCVTGTPDPVDVEVPTALIVIDSNSNVTEETIRNATSHLPAYKQLRGGFYFVESLPMTPSGKVQRRVVRDLANQLKINRQ